MRSEERKFLHDLTNPIAICFGTIKIISAKLKKDPSSVTPEYLETRFDHAIGAFERIIKMLEERRDQLVTGSSNSDVTEDKEIA